MAKTSKSTDEGYLVYPKERLISELDRETRGSEKTQTKSSAVRNPPPQLVRPGNMPTAPRDPLLATSWKEIENSPRTMKRDSLLATSWKEIEDNPQTKPAEPCKSTETKSGETVPEPGTTLSRRGSRRLSEYRDSEEILEILRERKELKLKRLSLQKEKREQRDEECMSKTTKQGRRASKEQKDLESRNSRRKSDSSRSGDIPRRTRRLSEYRDYDDLIAQNKHVAKAREKERLSISRYSEVIANQGQETTKATDAGPTDTPQ